MVSYAPRFRNDNTTGTGPNLAPNSYIICDARDYLENPVPFQSSSKRQCGAGAKLYTHAIYKPELEKSTQGGASLRNRAIRLVYPKGDTPGPCEYDPQKIEKGCKCKPPPCHGKGRLYMCRVPYSVYPTGPSVPTHINENGYDVDRNQNLVRIPPTPHDRSLGPAYYNVPTGEVFYTTKRYHKCCRWSISKSQRGKVIKSDSPAPNEYDTLPKRRFNKDDEEYREMARRFGFLPRYTESMMLKVASEDLPGPGSYNIKYAKCNRAASVCPRPFVSGAKRFGKGFETDSPAPGAYEICDCPTAHKQISIKDVPFGNNRDRFFVSKIRDTHPAPGDYNIKGSIQEKLDSKKNRYAVVQTPFCNGAERKLGEDCECLPGPGEYDVETDEVEEESVSASCFKSKTKRFRGLDKKESGGPATYNISKQFNKIRGKTSHYAGNVPFYTAQVRLAEEKTKTPGPADYIGQSKMGGKGSTFSVCPRFRKPPESDGPEPGTYTVAWISNVYWILCHKIQKYEFNDALNIQDEQGFIELHPKSGLQEIFSDSHFLIVPSSGGNVYLRLANIILVLVTFSLMIFCCVFPLFKYSFENKFF